MQYRNNFLQQKDIYKMIKVFLICTVLIHIIMLLKYAEAKNETASFLLFQRFKENYNKEYSDQESEERGYNNFVNHLIELIELNRKHSTRTIFYKLNQYADLNSKEVNEHSEKQISPYDTEPVYKDVVETEDSHESLDNVHVNDKDRNDALYATLIKKWGKPALKEILSDFPKYYRLVATADSNEQKLAGKLNYALSKL